MPASRIIELESDTFAQKDMGSYPGWKKVISFGIFVRAMDPKLPVEQSVYV